ncbi:MAG: hypothetical protein ACR2QT_02150 [Woeseiaceae bacterium]
MQVAFNSQSQKQDQVSGEFVDFAGERFYAIRNVDQIEPFFVSVISDVDHWLFVSSTGGLTAGRVSPSTALFPYITVDKIHDSSPHTGPKTIVRVTRNGGYENWEPFDSDNDSQFTVTRNLYKNLLGNKLCFEELNHDLQLVFRYTWATSDSYGFVRYCELENRGDGDIRADIVDGLQNILPAGTPVFAQTNTSNLVDAYKWSELDDSTGLALFALYSKITDRAEPAESLKANTVFSLGLNSKEVLISPQQIRDFKNGSSIQQETHKRGVRGAYLIGFAAELRANSKQHWQIVANVEQSQADVVALRRELADPNRVADAIAHSVEMGTDGLARIMASGDGFQATSEENVTVHHYANVLFNILRGGVFDDQYNVDTRDFIATIKSFNRDVCRNNQQFLDTLADQINFSELLSSVREQEDPQLERLAYEYLPITFGRRHGDPSRPWNQFAINVKDDQGNGLLSYQGNWRDIFQNWEALIFSYPGFVENVIAKFVNASTIDGYNPYRITKEGIDWEVEEPDDPWSYIGYWGDHQIIYLQKFLELSSNFHPDRLQALLRRSIFCYANVPYRIKPFQALLENPKDTVLYDEELAHRIERRVDELGADGKLLLDRDDKVYQVNLLEKLLVPLLSKMGNLVVDGGIWMNTQRPEWNDANNALVGHGVSMVTLYYLRRYVSFLQQLLLDESETFSLSGEVDQWLADTSRALSRLRPLLGDGQISESDRFAALTELGQAANNYREVVYRQEGFSGFVDRSVESIQVLLNDAQAAIDHSIAFNQRADGLYHAYNLLDLKTDAATVDHLYPMLEGQVASLSAGYVTPENAVTVLEALFDSDVYRPDQHSFMLYPDRPLPGFLEKNIISPQLLESIPLLQSMLATGDGRIVVCDADGRIRFNADLSNAGDLKTLIDSLKAVYGHEIEAARRPILDLYESVFHHKAFTGRSGTMFSFEGLGSIYWHMVAKLLLAVQENFFAAVDMAVDDITTHRLGELYYRIRAGIGFNKTPAEYGAFPTDPYSHTPKHAGARQPGMTGQVKEEILTRFGELGVRVGSGAVSFQPTLLREREFIAEPRDTGYVDVDGDWQTISVPPRGLAFTWCQVPIVYKLDDSEPVSLTIVEQDGAAHTLPQTNLPADESAELFQRSGKIRQLILNLHSNMLFAE